MKIVQILLIAGLSLLWACENDDDQPDQPGTSSADVLIINEGNFGFGNASISLYNSKTNEIFHKVFQSNNEGRPIGDVVQSAVQIDDRIFMVVNNSSKIEVVSKTDFKSAGAISGLNSPRYILPLSPTKAYVSDLYEDKIYIINPQSLTVSGAIETQGWTEEMVVADNKAFVCHVDSNQLWVINTENDSVIKKITTHKQPHHVLLDKLGNVWLSCYGDLNNGGGAIYRINSSNLQVEQVLNPSNVSHNIGKIQLNSAENELYYLSSGNVYRYNMGATNLPVQPFIEGTDRLFYGLKIDKVNDVIYVCDAIDYLQRGVISRYNIKGEELNTFKAGIIPGDVLFLNQ